MDFQVFIIGSDANAYYMARACYEEYHKKAHLIAKERLAFTKFSNILTISYYDNLWEEEDFVRILNTEAEKYEMPILVISTNETYSLLLARNQKRLAKNLVYFKQEEKVIKTLMNKEQFYKTYKKSSLCFPETYYFDVAKDQILPTMKYPMILKPANVVLYNHVPFEGKKKIYKIASEEELKETIALLKNSPYQDKMILQEFIPGNDSIYLIVLFMLIVWVK